MALVVVVVVGAPVVEVVDCRTVVVVLVDEVAIDVVVLKGGDEADVEVVELGSVEVGGGRDTMVVLVTLVAVLVIAVVVVGMVVVLGMVVVAGEVLTGVGVQAAAACEVPSP